VTTTSRAFWCAPFILRGKIAFSDACQDRAARKVLPEDCVGARNKAISGL
jgi:hypothetical protein